MQVEICSKSSFKGMDHQKNDVTGVVRQKEF